MIESPILMELIAEREALAERKMILLVLRARFGKLPNDIGLRLESYTTEAEIETVMLLATNCPTIESFLSQLPTPSLVTS